MDLREMLFIRKRNIEKQIKDLSDNLEARWDEMNEEARIRVQDLISDLEHELVGLKNQIDNLVDEAKDLYDVAESWSARTKRYLKGLLKSEESGASIFLLGLIFLAWTVALIWFF